MRFNSTQYASSQDSLLELYMFQSRYVSLQKSLIGCHQTNKTAWSRNQENWSGMDLRPGGGGGIVAIKMTFWFPIKQTSSFLIFLIMKKHQ